MGLNSWGPTTEVCFKDVDWILSAFHVFTVTQLELKYAKSTIFRRAALVLNSVYTWTSQINADLIRRYTRQKHCLTKSFYKIPVTQKQLKPNLLLILEIRKQWFDLMHGKKMQGLFLTITNKGHPEIPRVHCKLLKIKIY